MMQPSTENVTKPGVIAIVGVSWAWMLVAVAVAGIFQWFENLYLIGAWLVPSSLLVSGAFRGGGQPVWRSTNLVTAVVFSCVVAGLMASGGMHWLDPAAVFVSLVAWELLRRGQFWGAAGTLGLAAGGCLPAAGAASLLVVHRRPFLQRVAGVVVVLLVAASIQTVAGWPVPVSEPTVRLGIQNILRLVGDRLDVVMPALALALMSVFTTGLIARSAEVDDSDIEQRAATVWLCFNALLACCIPRWAADHALVFVLPAFLLIPSGWRAMRLLPLHPRLWTLSLFTLACWALLLMIVWVPLKVTGAALRVAWFAS